MESLGREYLRRELKEKGEADTVEDMLRVSIFILNSMTWMKHKHDERTTLFNYSQWSLLFRTLLHLGH